MERSKPGFEIWDLESGNLVGDHDRLEDALEAVRTNVRSRGPSALQGIALIEYDELGEDHLVAQGEELYRLTLPPSAAPGSRDATEKIGT